MVLKNQSKGKEVSDRAHFEHMTGLLQEGIFHAQGLSNSITFGSLHLAYMMCNWAQIFEVYFLTELFLVFFLLTVYFINVHGK